MWSRLKQLITNNIGLKILALLFSCLLWLVVINIDDPTQSRNFTATVTILNESVLTEQGKYYTIPDGQNTVTFRVTARRSVIEKLSGSDFTATADMNYLEDDSRIPVDIAANRYASSLSISSKIHYLTIDVGDEMSSNFVIKGQTVGEPADGFEVNTVTVTPNVLSVSGPEEIVSTISTVEAVCDVSEMSSDVTESVVPILYDKNGEEVAKTNLTLNVETVEISVDMMTVKEVPIEVETSGRLGDGLELDTITADPEKITVKGESEVVNSLTAITIPGTVIDLSTITADVDTTVDISSYLPDGVLVSDASAAKVVVSVKLVKEETKKLTVPTENLSIHGLAEGLEATFDDESITIEVTGLASVVDDMDASSVTGVADAEGLDAGKHIVSVTINADTGVTVGAVTCGITITAKQ